MILDDIVKAKTERLKQHKANISEEEMKRLALESRRQSVSFYDALKKDGLSIIGEFKKASPSHGKMDSKIDLASRIKCYNAAVDAISCLTEEDYFNGGVDYLKQIRAMTQLPIIRKDFIIDEYQVYEAKVIGADAILLIAAILDDEKFRQLYDLAYSLGLDVLCEVHDEKEMLRMINLNVKIIGINNRNLKTFEVSLETTKRLADMAPRGTVLVSESGVLDNDDIRTLKLSGADALLIGTAFMEAENPQELALEWKSIYNERQDNSVKVKICGITSVEEAGYLNTYKADYAGMVLFYEKSKRNIDIVQAKTIIAALDDNVKSVAVVVSPNVEQAEAIREAGFDYIQIHGELTEAVYENIKMPIIRAVNIANVKCGKTLASLEKENLIREEQKINQDIVETIKKDKICAVLLDSKTPGSGNTFDWSIAAKAGQLVKAGGKELWLAGGLNKDNVGKAIEIVSPDVVDTSSGVEYNGEVAGSDKSYSGAPENSGLENIGLANVSGDTKLWGKSPKKIRKFIESAKAVD